MRSLCAALHNMFSAWGVCVRVSRCGIVMWGVLWCVGVSRAWACGVRLAFC